MKKSSPLSRRRGLFALGGVVLLALLLALWGLSNVESPEAGEDGSTPASSSAPEPSRRSSGGGAPSKAPLAMAQAQPSAGAMQVPREVWEKRLARARHTLDSYRESTRYPPQSRPISEHPDQVHPAAPEREQSVRDANGEDSGVRLRLRQSRVSLAGDEFVDLSVACEDARGMRQRCEIQGAQASEPLYLAGSGSLTPVPVVFADAGQPGDAAADDGVFTARFQPARQGFALYSGQLTIAVKVVAAGVPTNAGFDLMYTRSPPATFTGRVRDVVDGGSLHFDVGLQVRKPGRYVLAGRVDDAEGKPFAYVSFNDVLPEGAQQARFTVFGKLMRDAQPKQPLLLRDVEGFLLLETGDPDRELLNAQLGPVHTARTYAITSFSDAEWESEERQRYLDELGNDVKRAEEGLASTPP